MIILNIDLLLLGLPSHSYYYHMILDCLKGKVLIFIKLIVYTHFVLLLRVLCESRTQYSLRNELTTQTD